MSKQLGEPPSEELPLNGGAPARRAVMRWAWRLFRNEWRQQLLMLALITVAVGALFVAAAVATNNPTPANVGFGSAKDLATFEGAVPHLAAKVAALERRFGRVEVTENETLTIPGTTETYQLRAESSHGPFSAPMLSLLSGRYPSSASEAALTQGVASGFNLRIGSNWTEGGVTRKVVFTVEEPTSPAKDPWGNTRVGASATTRINRKDFGLAWNTALETGGILVGDEVAINLDVEFVKA